MHRRPRVLFLTLDGPRGLGHLSRAAKLAQSVQESAACLITTGLRDTCHLLPENCEYVRVPGLDGLPGFQEPASSAMAALGDRARSIRRELFLTLERTFSPDLIVAEQYPTGWYGEWEALLAHSRALKWIVFRPVPGTNTVDVVDDAGRAVLAEIYDTFLIASDRRTAVVDDDLGFTELERAKCRYIGYASLPVSEAEIAEARAQRGLAPGERWVVCSAGAGLVTADLIEDCLRLAGEFPDLQFDIVAGPRGRSAANGGLPSRYTDGRIRFATQRRDLRVAHAAADVVICHGGYNTVSEAMQGGAALIVDGRRDVNDERQRHARLLQRHYPVALAVGTADLAHHLRAVLSENLDRRRTRARAALDLGGCANFARLVADRLG